ncbi:MAG TPA: hypothetical protein VMS17_03250 [Gemmataceae bacterium]|nr:hypothetical protein [Gemmataceae bacterium]
MRLSRLSGGLVLVMLLAVGCGPAKPSGGESAGQSQGDRAADKGGGKALSREEAKAAAALELQKELAAIDTAQILERDDIEARTRQTIVEAESRLKDFSGGRSALYDRAQQEAEFTIKQAQASAQQEIQEKAAGWDAKRAEAQRRFAEKWGDSQDGKHQP